jgi:hypothetical protein
MWSGDDDIVFRFVNCLFLIYVFYSIVRLVGCAWALFTCVGGGGTCDLGLAIVADSTKMFQRIDVVISFIRKTVLVTTVTATCVMYFLVCSHRCVSFQFCDFLFRSY